LINPSRTSLKIVAVVLGIFIADAQFVLFSAWLNRQADDEAKSTSAWARGSSELRLGQAIAVLQDLAAQGVDSCRPGHVDAMRQAALRTGPVKQIVLLAKNIAPVATLPDKSAILYTNIGQMGWREIIILTVGVVLPLLIGVTGPCWQEESYAANDGRPGRRVCRPA